MQKRKLRKNNLEVTAIGLGCMSMSFGYSPAGDQQEMILFPYLSSVRAGDRTTAFGQPLPSAGRSNR
jgi:hypothetical protein